jgi:hypothetical protein
MSDQQTKELLYNILQALQQNDPQYATTLAQHGIARINAASNTAPLLTKQLNYEDDGELIWASPAKRGR